MRNSLYVDLDRYLAEERLVILYGPRGVGKTPLVTAYLAASPLRHLIATGENVLTRELLISRDRAQLTAYVHGYDRLVLLDAQTIPHVGDILQLLRDTLPTLQIIAVSATWINPGGARILPVYPISQLELQAHAMTLQPALDDYLLFGSYPAVLAATSRQEKISVLTTLVGTVLLQDTLRQNTVKDAQLLLRLLKVLALGIGQAVSLGEIGETLRIDPKTVGRYITLLEHACIITRVTGFNRKLAAEVIHKAKYYFVDTGIRNAMISQFNSFDSRTDIEQLFENFIVVERLKKRVEKHIPGHAYFWQTYTGQHIDLLEEREGVLFAYACRFATKHTPAHPPKAFRKAYPSYATFEVITPENYLDFIA